MSSEAQWALMRAEPRLEVLPVEVKGLLQWPKRLNQQVPFLVWDLSTRGIGLLLSDKLKPGDEVNLTFGNPAFTMKCSVIWCDEQKPDYEFQEPSYRCGLLVEDATALFRKLVEQVENQKK
jgi:hypothetical protein